jgi:hypothetical protein
MPGKLHFKATIHRVAPGTNLVVDVLGREAWALRELIKSGAAGATPIDNPAPRWSHYVWLLRGHGFNVETVDESHAGPFAGTHARYVLRDQVTAEGGNLAEWEGVNVLQTRVAA